MRNQTKQILELIEERMNGGKYAEEIEKTIHLLHVIFFFKEQMDEHVGNDVNYIGSEEFHSLHSSIDYNKLKLIKEISNL